MPCAHANATHTAATTSRHGRPMSGAHCVLQAQTGSQTLMNRVPLPNSASLDSLLTLVTCDRFRRRLDQRRSPITRHPATCVRTSLQTRDIPS